MTDAFYEEGPRLLTVAAFHFVLELELRRALRSQNFLTLLVFDARREWKGLMVAADEGTVSDLARVVGEAVRDTDLIARTDDGVLSLALLDADFDSSLGVVDRLVSRMNRYEFLTPLHISVGAACYPTHAVDFDSLKLEAAMRPVTRWRRPNRGHA